MARSAQTVIKVKVLPRSSRTALAGKEDNLYRVKVTDPPVEGRANKALIALLAETLGIPKREIEIISGKTGRLKTVRIRAMTPEDVAHALQKTSTE